MIHLSAFTQLIKTISISLLHAIADGFKCIYILIYKSITTQILSFLYLKSTESQVTLDKRICQNVKIKNKRKRITDQIAIKM